MTNVVKWVLFNVSVIPMGAINSWLFCLNIGMYLVIHVEWDQWMRTSCWSCFGYIMLSEWCQHIVTTFHPLLSWRQKQKRLNSSRSSLSLLTSPPSNLYSDVLLPTRWQKGYRLKTREMLLFLLPSDI